MCIFEKLLIGLGAAALAGAVASGVLSLVIAYG
jgi:hypothetical protein